MPQICHIVHVEKNIVTANFINKNVYRTTSQIVLMETLKLFYLLVFFF